jgi:hypothetical protein
MKWVKQLYLCKSTVSSALVFPAILININVPRATCFYYAQQMGSAAVPQPDD